MTIEQGLAYLKNTNIDRRQSLRAALGSGLVLLGLAQWRSCESPRPRGPRTVSEVMDLIQQGTSLRTLEDNRAIFQTRAGIDLPYSRLETAARIRSIDDPIQKVTAAIGYLDVENPGNRRYDVPDGACNIYALDLLRLVLGNEAIGSRYDARNGSPAVFGLNDADWTDNAAIRRINSQFTYLAAFNLDNWMRSYGPRYGWIMVDSQAKLKELMRSGEYVALGVSKDENTRGRAGTGHSYVLTYGPDGYGLTQATNNISYKLISPDNDEKSLPGRSYNIHAHKIPNTQR